MWRNFKEKKSILARKGEGRTIAATGVSQGQEFPNYENLKIHGEKMTKNKLNEGGLN